MFLQVSKDLLVSPTKTCLICSNKIDMCILKNGEEFKEKQRVCEIFCRVACRYLNFNCGGDGGIKAEQTITANTDINQADDSNLLCDNCFPLAESFCEIYHNFKQLELIFHWRMREFVDLIRVQMEKGIDLDTAMECGSSEKRSRGSTNFRKKFLTRGNQTLVANDIPKLQLRKIKLDTEKLQTRKITTDSNRNSNTVQKEIVFKDELDTNSKIEIKKEILNYDCHLFKFRHTSSLNHHGKTKHPGEDFRRNIKKQNVFECSVCDRVFGQLSHKVMHERSHFNPELNQDTEKRPNIEKDTASKDNSITSENCPTTKRPEIILEKVVDTGNKIEKQIQNYDCQFCGKSFEGLQNLQNHEEETHFNSGSPREIHKCPTCDKPYSNKGSLYVHMETHSGKIHRCSICDKEFSTAHTLARHQNSQLHLSAVSASVARSTISNNANPPLDSDQKELCTQSGKYVCNMCDKLFANKNYLRIHERVHSGDKPFKCRICQRGFTTSGNLTVHERLHDNVKPYKCAICGQKFRHTTSLKLHGNLKHPGEDFYGPKKKSSFECSFCDKVFRELSHKVMHEKSHSKVGPYKCKFCVRRFSFRAPCETHQKACPDFKRMNSHINQSSVDNSNLRMDITDNNEIDEGVTKLIKVDISCSNGSENEEILQEEDKFILPD